MARDSDRLRGAIAVTRFGLGARPGEIEAASNDPQGWLRAQIRREGADQPVGAPLPQPTAKAPAAMGAMTAPGEGANAPTPPAQLSFAAGQSLPSMREAYGVFASYQDQKKADKGDPLARRDAVAPLYQMAGEEILARARLAAGTGAPFRERWALFWANHFTVSAKSLPMTVATGPFEREAIRPNVFGRFEDLLVASTGHPGMLLYLDQAQSIGPNSPAGVRGRGGLNENLGREILELHTVGADAGYTQADVTEFARALTGWSIGRDNARESAAPGTFIFRPQVHEPGARTVMGKTYSDDQGFQALAILKTLAAHPKTAARLSHKIAAHFVADDPPPALVAHLTQAWVTSRGDLGQVAAALIEAPEAWAPRPAKFKTPYEFMASMYRAADTLPVDPAKEVVQPLKALGQAPFGAAQPNGWSDVAADWAAPDAIVKRLTWAQAFAAAHVPQTEPKVLAASALGERLTPKTATAVARAESRPEAFAILVMSPEFQRR